ncbi:MAG: IS110 family transposase [Pseudomonadota bacterium]
MEALAPLLPGQTVGVCPHPAERRSGIVRPRPPIAASIRQRGLHPSGHQPTLEVLAMQSDRPNWGGDCSEDWVVLACDGRDEVIKVANRAGPLRQWLRSLPGPIALAVESTGRYPMVLANAAHRLVHRVYVLDPYRVRHYARSTAFRGKTDPIDARIIARFLAREQDNLHPYKPPTAQQRRIDSLLRRRARLVVMHQQLNALAGTLNGHTAALRGTLDSLERLIRDIERSADALAHRNAQTAARCDRLRTIVGSGVMTSIALSNLFDRVTFESADKVVAFIGHDPRPDDSGDHRGKRHITKRGNSELRRLLHNAAMAAARTATWRPCCQRSLKRGLATIEALCELARRLPRVAWAIDRHRLDFDPKRVRIA